MIFALNNTRRRIAVLMAATAVVALAGVLFNPRFPAWTEDRAAPAKDEMALDEALSRAGGILWVDARPAAEYAKGRVPGALPLNEDAWDALLPAVLSAWRPGMRVVVYCDSQQCRAGREVAGRLRGETGLADVFVLKGGWESWQRRAQ